MTLRGLPGLILIAAVLLLAVPSSAVLYTDWLWFQELGYQGVFLKSPAEAFRIMMLVHTEGKGLCGLYPYDIAETKVSAVHDLARERGFPLRASLEEE